MTKARIQPFCRANIFNLGYYDGERVFSRSVGDGNNALYLCNNHSYLIWKSQGVSFSQVIQELKDNFKMVGNYITEENVKSHFKYEFIPKKTDSHLSNFIVYDLETRNTDRARPYIMTFYRLSKIAGRYERDPTQDELKKNQKRTLLPLMEINVLRKFLDFCLK